MVLVTLEVMSTARSMARVDSNGPMALSTPENSITTTSTVMAPTSGLTTESTLVNGSTTKWKAKVFSLGRTGEYTKESTKTTKRKVLAFSNGLMAGAIEASGRAAYSTGRGSTLPQTSLRRKASGKRVNESSGSQ